MISSSKPPLNYPLNFIETLRDWANSPQAEKDLEAVFGQRIDWATAYRHVGGLQRGDISNLPPVKILPSESMPGLWGGYSRDLRLVFLSADCPEKLVVPVLLEEIGHFFDQEFCKEETPGDEGALFSALVLGNALNSREAEDDTLWDLDYAGFVVSVEAAPKVRGKGKPKTRGNQIPPSSSGSGSGSTTATQTVAGQKLTGTKGNDTFTVISSDVRIEDTLGGNDTVLAKVDFDLTPFNFIENLTLFASTSAVKGIGNSLSNVITGNGLNNELDGGAGNDSLYGGAGDDNLLGGEGNDFLDGGAGNDYLVGGSGNDTYLVDSSNIEADTFDQIGEEEDGGIDTVLSSVSYRLSDFLEVLTLTGSSQINAYGNISDNTITGNSIGNSIYGEEGNDLLNGAAGADSLFGGDGNDTFIVDNVSDRVFENEDSGTDFVVSSATYTLSDYLENLTLSGENVISGYGNSLSNIIVGNSRANTISGDSGDDSLIGGEGSDSIVGGLGADSLYGGAGSDTLVVDSSDNIINGGTELDWVFSSDSVDLANGRFTAIENISLIGGAAVHATGNNLTNVIIGNSLSNSLNGGQGIDSMVGGVGNDTYFVDNAADKVLELSSADSDWVSASISYSLLTNFENLILSGSQNLNGAGNNLGNYMIGNSGKNSLNGGSGNDTLDGGTGADTLIGGDGNDVYYVDNVLDVVNETNSSSLTGGIDLVFSSVSYSLTNNVERLTLTGTDSLSGTGNSVANTLSGNTGNNTLNGGGGNDSIFGGGGNDSLFGSAGSDTLVGDTGDDTIDGDSDNDSIVGGGGNDILTGGAGIDTLIGGGGNDTYYVSDSLDQIFDSAGINAIYYISGTNLIKINGLDFNPILGNTVIGGVSFDLYELPTLISGDNSDESRSGGTGNDTILGNGGNDSITGDAGNDSLNGGSGNDTLVGNADNDTLIGGDQNDSLVGGSGSDSLIGGNHLDTLLGDIGDDYLDGGDSPDSLVGGAGNDTIIYRGTTDTIEGGSETDLVISDLNVTLTGAQFTDNIENLLLTGSSATLGIGNTIANFLTGNSSANSLLGGEGNDTINGGIGNDTILGGNDNDSLAGSEGADSLLGEAGNDILDGGEGLDTLEGGAGNDTYIIYVNQRDTIIESVSAGTADEIQVNGSFSIADPANLPIGTPPPGEYSGIEVLRYTGIGNVSLTGNKLANTIIAGAGADFLTGGLGADSLIGGSGNDTYIYEGSDTLVELASGGVDEVRSSEDINLTSISEVENIVLTGSGSIAAIGNSSHNSILGNAAGNVLTGGSGNDTILGNAGDDQLDGGAGTDSLIGGLGNDTYILDVSLSDQIVENPGEGTDEIRVAGSVDLTLLLAIENIVLQGADSHSAIGNASGNRIQGNAGNNSLDGGGGVDTLIGGAGDDTYFVDVAGDIVQEQIGSGNDQVISTGGSFVLPNFVENLKVNGGQGSSGTGNLDPNIITGNLSDNSLFGGGGGADTLVGDEGDDYLDGGFDNQVTQSRDSMVGGVGDDTYVIGSGGAAGDLIVEQSGEGQDTVEIRPTLLSYVRNRGIDPVVFGINPGGVAFVSPSAGPPLEPGGGAQIQLFFDKLVAGDLYYNLANDVPDANVAALLGANYIADRNYFYALPVNFENLDIYNQSITVNGFISGATQFQPNFVYGNSSANYIKTLDEVAVIGGFNNHIDGQGGADTMAGGLGSDTYVVDDSGDLVIELSSQGTDWIFASASFTLQANVEHLRQMEVTETMVNGQPDTLAVGDLNFHGTGNELNNLIEGNSGNNSLVGLGGADTITGGAGNDTLLGGDGTDSLVGGDGIDSMVGGAGNDIYSVENEADAIVDSSGFDIVFSSQSYVLLTELEVLVLQGSNNIAGWGNSNANSLVGNSVNNILVGYDGDDTLDGGDDIGNLGGGNDTLSGGAGNDFYFLRNAGDIITENANQGTDTVFSLDNHNLAVNFENLILGGAAITGQGNAVANSLTANATLDSDLQGLAGNDTIVGGAGDDILSGGDDNDTILGGGGNDNLDGGAAVDSLAGGTGNDTYIVTAGDVVFEASGAGVDEIQSSVDFTLSSNVENLLLTGAGHLNGTGNGLSNDITGNTGDNSLFGLGGRDNLMGLEGSDTLDGGDLEDSLVGGIGSDFLLGGDGSDMLNGTDSTARGANEIDTLTGGAGRDLFVLGDGTNANYNTAANGGDYAYITDFSANLSSFDQLQLRNLTTGATHANTVNGYLVGAQQYGVVGLANSYLYRDNDNNGSIGAGDNLIAAIVAADGTGVGGALQTSDLNTIGIFI